MGFWDFFSSKSESVNDTKGLNKFKKMMEERSSKEINTYEQFKALVLSDKLGEFGRPLLENEVGDYQGEHESRSELVTIRNAILKQREDVKQMLPEDAKIPTDADIMWRIKDLLESKDAKHVSAYIKEVTGRKMDVDAILEDIKEQTKTFKNG